MNSPATKRQMGGAQLLIVLLLMGATLVLIYSVANSTLVRQKISTNQHIHTELRLAAESGLAITSAWLGNHQTTWRADLDHPGWESAALPPVQLPNTGIYRNEMETRARAIRRSPYSPFIRLSATTRRKDHSHGVYTVSQYLSPNGGPVHAGLDLPPLVIGACLHQVNNGISIYPRDWGKPIQHWPGVLRTTDQGTLCAKTDSLFRHDTGVRYQSINTDLWNHIFRISREEVKKKAEDIDSNVIWANNSAIPFESYGSIERPVIVVITPSPECPPAQAHTTIHGIVYIDGNCTQTGGFTVYGSLILGGNIDTLVGNTRLHHYSELTDGPLRFTPDGITKIPGTWVDF